MSNTLSGRMSAELSTVDTGSTPSFEKNSVKSTENLIPSESQDFEKADKPVVANMEEIALKALHVDDDPTLNPWTFRMFFLGKHTTPALMHEGLLIEGKALDSLRLAQHLQQSSYSSHKVSLCQLSS